MQILLSCINMLVNAGLILLLSIVIHYIIRRTDFQFSKKCFSLMKWIVYTSFPVLTVVYWSILNLVYCEDSLSQAVSDLFGNGTIPDFYDYIYEIIYILCAIFICVIEIAANAKKIKLEKYIDPIISISGLFVIRMWSYTTVDTIIANVIKGNFIYFTYVFWEFLTPIILSIIVCIFAFLHKNNRNAKKKQANTLDSLEKLNEKISSGEITAEEYEINKKEIIKNI